MSIRPRDTALSLPTKIVLPFFLSVSLWACGMPDSEPGGQSENGSHLGETTRGAKTDTAAQAEPVAGDGPEGCSEPCPNQAAPACGAESPENLMGCVAEDLYFADVVFVAQERAPGSGHWQAVQDLCRERLKELGFTVERHVYDTGVNIVGTLAGTDPGRANILVGAHYEHLRGCTGADDNASGVAGVLELARVIAGAKALQGTLQVACWDEEESGLIGSRAFAQRAAAEGTRYDAVYSLDMIAFTDTMPGAQRLPDNLELLFPAQVERLAQHEFKADFIPVSANQSAGAHAEAFVRYAQDIGLMAIPFVIYGGMELHPLLSDFGRSDHAPFWEYDYPGLFISDTAELRNPHYHCRQGDDDIDTLDIPFAVKVVQALVGAVAEGLE